MNIDRFARRLAGRAPEPLGITERYAVLVPLAEIAGRIHLLYEVRAADLRRQPGEVCFPGGRMEPGEDAVACALRETREELGIPADRVRVLGRMDFLCHRDSSVLYPVAGLVETDAVRALSPAPEEVAEALLIPVDELLSIRPEEYEYELVPRMPRDFPYRLLQIPTDYPWRIGRAHGCAYPWGDRVVWGITAQITRRVLELWKEG